MKIFLIHSTNNLSVKLMDDGGNKKSGREKERKIKNKINELALSVIRLSPGSQLIIIVCIISFSPYMLCTFFGHWNVAAVSFFPLLAVFSLLLFIFERRL